MAWAFERDSARPRSKSNLSIRSFFICETVEKPQSQKDVLILTHLLELLFRWYLRFQNGRSLKTLGFRQIRLVRTGLQSPCHTVGRLFARVKVGGWLWTALADLSG